MTARSSYELVPYFVLRMAGFPVELVRELREAELGALVDAVHDAARRTTDVGIELSRAARRRGAWAVIQSARARRTVRRPVAAELESFVAAFEQSLADEQRLRGELARHFELAFARNRTRLGRIVRSERFLDMLRISGQDDLAARAAATTDGLEPRGPREREREQTWTSYLQRVTMKNDTISFFGPTVWGRVDPAHRAAASVALEDPERHVRTVYLERWAAEALFERILQDEEVAPFVPVDVADDVELVASGAVQRAGVPLDLTADELQILVASGTNGAATARDAAVRGLLERGVLVRRLAISPSPITTVRRIVASFPDGDAKRRWEASLAALEERTNALANAADVEARTRARTNLGSVLHEIGVADRRPSRALYASRLAVNEDCARAAREAVVGAPLVDLLTAGLERWYELWRDLAGVYARASLDALAPIWKSAASDGPPSLASFLRAAASAGLPFGRSGGVGMLRDVDAAIQRAWAEQIGARANDAEIELDDDDLAFARRRLRVRRLRAFDWPAPDVQLAARGAEALRADRFQAVLAEIHPSFVLWGHCFFWSCPDPAGFAASFKAAGVAPCIEFAPSGLYDGPTHNTRHAPFWLPGWTFTGPLRVDGQRAVRSAEAKVFLEDDDLVVRAPDGARLGSLIDTWLVAMNTHRLELLGTASHAPRMRVGGVVVQRRTWIVEVPAALRKRLNGPFALGHVEALRELRREQGLPEEIFVRAVLATRTANHKALKPIYVDFRSPLLLELLASNARRYHRLHVSEALPTADDAWLADASGHYTCELRLSTRPAREGTAP